MNNSQLLSLREKIRNQQAIINSLENELNSILNDNIKQYPKDSEQYKNTQFLIENNIEIMMLNAESYLNFPLKHNTWYILLTKDNLLESYFFDSLNQHNKPNCTQLENRKFILEKKCPVITFN